MKKILWVFSIAFMTFSCTNDNGVDANIEVKEGEKRSKLSAGSQSAEELKKAAEERKKKQEEAEKERLANQTTMEITPNVYDFGAIPKETPVSTVFTVKNTGDKPLIINDAKASCGCTVPRKPEEPIMPGEEGELEVTFESNAAQAGKPMNKTVTVTANIPGSTKMVTIKGMVDN
ncbi:hypothetical protein CW751_03195 [Brumimicrobium salinarum]|uniref:DUF1573 domain-containing protein n=1 Tax=Brumimicrobium salinarum TaxID=2058658 RepID=A0A2I0R4N7_9FLAO|nr:DUF1573 domain-containing protein [Brumimicrobium salinarum]PKR81545.1 hypothetical protein CW751_03195 [Brumimicrobium salinarum]